MRSRLAPILAAASLAVGCAADRQPSASAKLAPIVVPPAPATSLAFAPDFAADEPMPDREDRQVVAYAGYEAQVVSQTFTVQDDRQRYDRSGRDNSYFERRSVSTSVTVRAR